MNITVKQIEIFLAVANAHSISAAARELYISQPAVSSTITEMERQLGVELLVRSHKGAMLTTEGKRLYAELDPVYKRFVFAASEIFHTKEKHCSECLKIGALHDPEPIKLMLASAQQHNELYPACTVTTGYYKHYDLRNMLLCGNLDLVFTFSVETKGDPELDCRRICTLDQYFVVPQTYCDIDGSDFRFLRSKPLILEVSSRRETMLDICSAHGFQPSRIVYVSSYLLLTQMIADGEGFTIGGPSLPNLSAVRSRIAFVPVAVTDCNNYIHLVVAWRQGSNRPEIKKFLEVLEMPEVLSKAAAIRKFPHSKWYS
ncbi:MAG: LysR family transcriptional regulator [Oscillospiraceae bacterium]|nr:LysR family transcriptional regulator [Oscillospiraceae bacterium]